MKSVSQTDRRDSDAFITLVKNWIGQRGVDQEVQDAVALWCRNQPAIYQHYIWNSVGIKSAHISPSSKNEVDAAIRTLARNVRKNGDIAFVLMDDGARLADEIREFGCQALPIYLGRRSFPTGFRKQLYFELFSLVNSSALSARGNAVRFHKKYREMYGRYVRSNHGNIVRRVVEQVIQPHIKILSQQNKQKSCITVVDTGMQGTFILPLLETLKNISSFRRIRFTPMLLSVYPWLQDVYHGQFVTTSTSYVFQLEQRKGNT
ncbi:MAG: hypothetical protein WC864_07125 [Ilumatobacteraceae bacterium]